jgi:hypothetical protein
MDNSKRIIERIVAVLIIIVSLFACSRGSTLPLWMIGNWQTQVGDYQVTENWQLTNGKLVGNTIWKNNQTHFDEKSTISVTEKGLKLHIVIGKRVVVFRANSSNSDTLVFKINSNDFPKRICYTLTSENKLSAWIENKPNDPNKITFSHKRIVHTEH